MAYCPKCGQKVEDHMKFCTNCGNQLRSETDTCPTTGKAGSDLPIAPWGQMICGEKSGLVAVILSLILPGIGTAYAGNVARGILTLIGMIILFPAMLFVSAISGALAESGSLSLIFMGISVLVYLVAYVLCVIDSYRHCCISNELWRKYLMSR